MPVSIKCSISGNINLAFYQNAVPIIRELAIENASGTDLNSVEVHLSAEPTFITPGVWRIEKIADQNVHHLRVLDIKLDHAFLATLTNPRRSEILVRVESADHLLSERKIEVNLLPPAHWGGLASAPELLASFVLPRDASVDAILREAADRLAQKGFDAALDGYAKKKKRRAWEIAAAIWSAIVAHGIAYALPPASFESVGQPVRSPSEILTRKVGTCLDLTLLFAACLEQAGLNPLLILTQGHAFAGFWLNDEKFSTPVIDDSQMLRKRLQLEEIMVVETTALTQPNPASFSQATALATKHLDEEATSPFELAVDVRKARAADIRPLDLSSPSDAITPNVAPAQTIDVEDPPAFEEDMDRSAPAPDRVIDRLEAWKNSLLDLTLRNRLLNFKDNKATIRIECPDLARLEDRLAEGRRFKLHGKATVLDGSDGRDPELIRERQNEDARKAYILDAFERNDLYADIPDAEIDARLTDLYRAARLAFEEGGANILYLCIGFLKWAPHDNAGPYRAPLLLIPVQLQRKSVRSGFHLALHEDETRFNPTLLQLLKRDFGLSLPQLESDLPSDGSGVDVGGILKLVRQNIKDIKRFEVVDRVVLTTLSFTKYLMWKDLVDRTEVLKRNPVVRHLIDTPTHSYVGEGGEFIEPTRLDDLIHPSELFAPLSADSSQIAAVVAAQRGTDFVLFGPPGTGKSQTITNMITNCLAHGKTVLFVSQKTAALEVVRRRLGDVGLGSYCLEVHSTKAQKSSVVSQLATAWDNRSTSFDEQWTESASDLKAKRDALNKLVHSLHRRRDGGVTAYELFGRVVSDADKLPQVELAWPAGAVHSKEEIAAMRDCCANLRSTLSAIGDPAKHPLRGIEQTKWTPQWSQDIQRLAGEMKPAIIDLEEKLRNFIASIGLQNWGYGISDQLLPIRFGGQLMAAEAANGVLLLGDDAPARTKALRALANLIARANSKKAELSVEYDIKATTLDLKGLQSEWTEACATNFLFRGSNQKKVRLALQPYCKGEVPQDIGRDLIALQHLAELADEAKTLAPSFDDMPSLWQGLETDVTSFEPLIAWAAKAREAAASLGAKLDAGEVLQKHMVTLVTEHGHLFVPGGLARAAFEHLTDSFVKFRHLAQDFSIALGLDAASDLISFSSDWPDDLRARIDRWTANLVKAPAWTKWRHAAASGRSAGLGPLIDAIEAGAVSSDLIAPTFEFNYARWRADEIVTQDETLSSFLAEQHEALIEAFAAADKKVAELSKGVVRARIGGTVPTRTNFGANVEWGALAREVEKKARHLPLRQLFGKIPSVLNQLAPCMMMSPLSIAQYLPPDAKPFDVVIFDEASQIPVWDAIGAIARGKQVIVVGDPEQLPPTSVGQRGVDDQDDDGGVVQTQQSILDECLSSNLPSLRLTWHYRSRHESLIAFSNAKYYHGELVTFPSPLTEDTAVRFVHVEGGVYERGGAKVNRKEAEAVVAEIVRKLATADTSIGVVTFNAEQQRLIENLLDQARRSDPSLERHFDKAQTNEPLFVKNIENVQGDERDLIIFSVAVSADHTGRITAQISSLNGEGGHRRLNVAVTRARQELLVFSSMLPEQVDLGRTNARGVVDFKHFLEFAKNGSRAIAEAFAPTGRSVDSPFEDAVKRALESKGWIVHPQIGVSFFRVDLGIVHPDAAGRYLAGVECDGATYHRSATARDRDRLRELALTNLGWRIRRIWSTEWWMDATSALEKIHARLSADLEADRAAATASEADTAETTAPASAGDEVIVELPLPDRPTAQGDDLDMPLAPRSDNDPPPSRLYARHVEAAPTIFDEYHQADVSAICIPDKDRFYDPSYRAMLRMMVDHVVETEGPVYFDLIVDRVARAHGFQRAKDGIRGALKSALGVGRFPISHEGERELIWPKATQIASSSPYRTSPTRTHADIPLPELTHLAARFLATGLEREEAVRAMQEHFHLARLAQPTRERFETAVDHVGRAQTSSAETTK
ncbi:MAG: DUF3320 domain-containing protein [Hyphomicrobiales bacterium]|nr:DUF3320 domain-containing protein [Hyphomicrobiales bacterium]